MGETTRWTDVPIGPFNVMKCPLPLCDGDLALFHESACSLFAEPTGPLGSGSPSENQHWADMRRIGKKAAGRDLDGRTWGRIPGGALMNHAALIWSATSHTAAVAEAVRLTTVYRTKFHDPHAPPYRVRKRRTRWLEDARQRTWNEGIDRWCVLAPRGDIPDRRP